MRKSSIILLSLIGIFSVIGLSPVVAVNAQAPRRRLNILALYARGLQTSKILDAPNQYYAFFLIQNNIAFAFGVPLDNIGWLGGLPALGHAWYAHLGLSKYVETLGSPFHFISVQNLRSVGSIYPGVLEVYNDSKYPGQYDNGICDTHLWGVGSNVSEIAYYLHLKNYTSVDIMPLSPAPISLPDYEISTVLSDITYTWGVNYTNVGIDIKVPWIWWPLATIDTAIMDYMNISYELDFDSDGSYELRQNLHFGDTTPTNVSLNGLSLSVIQFNFAQTLSFDLSVNTKARNETGHIVSDPDNSTLFRKATISVGMTDLMTLDLASTKANYTLGGTPGYSVKATSVPWYQASYEGKIVDGTYDHNLKWQRTVTAFQHRTCYPFWNGSKIDHDPIFGMNSPPALLISFDVNKNGWVPTAAIGGVFATVSVVILITAVVIHRREK